MMGVLRLQCHPLGSDQVALNGHTPLMPADAEIAPSFNLDPFMRMTAKSPGEAGEGPEFSYDGSPSEASAGKEFMAIQLALAAGAMDFLLQHLVESAIIGTYPVYFRIRKRTTWLLFQSTIRGR
ncbi:MAG: hypothetical protein ABIA59_03830 [Candidatus Latescibacterota bacterium]